MEQCFSVLTTVGVVKSTNKTNIVIQPMETQTISGFVRKARNVEAAIKEHTEGASSRLGVCPGSYHWRKLEIIKECQ